VTAVALRLRAEFRVRWRSWLALGVAVGIGAGAVSALVAASHRTRSAYGRYLHATAAGDAYVDAGLANGDPGLDVGRFGRLAQVERSERTFLVAVISRSRSGRPVFPSGPGHVQYQVPSDDRSANAIDVPLVRRGRLPNPNRPDEALADAKALRSLGIDVGDTLTVRVVRDDVLRRRIATLHLSYDPRSEATAAWGPLATVRVVGVQAHAKADIDGGYVNFTPAFRRTYGGARIGHWAEELAVRLRHHAADVPAFADAVHRAAAGHPYGLYDPGASRPVIQRSIDLLVEALGLVTLAGAGAALLLGGQALVRLGGAEAAAVPTLRALGMTHAQLVVLAALRGAVVAAPAVGATVATALALSPLAPVGWARELDPHRGVQVDLATTGLAAAIVLAAIVGVSALAGWAAVRTRSDTGAFPLPRLHSLARLPARAGLPPCRRRRPGWRSSAPRPRARSRCARRS
jgi:hypothetical protein